MQCYMVGGAVRDLLMGAIPKDADMAFSGSEEAFMQAFPQAQLVGKSVRVWVVNGKEYMPLYQNCIAADLKHRDLTINALALDAHGLVYAHPMAFFDIKNHILRPASPTAFHHDPLRVFRLARFAAAYPHFTVHESAVQQAQAVAEQGSLKHIPAERVGRELLKALHMPSPSRFIHILEKTQTLMPWFKELAHEDTIRKKWTRAMDIFALKDIEQNMGQSMEQSMEQSRAEYAVKNWMLLGAVWENTEKKALQEHPLYTLGQRLHLPLSYTKAAHCMADTFTKACQIQSLPLSEQVLLLHRVHKLNLTKPYWEIIKYLHSRENAHYALKALKSILQVHLPQNWQNLGALSGEKLLELQCQALQNNVKR